MVKIGLQLKAFLENVTDLEGEDDDFRYYKKLILRYNECNSFSSFL